MGETRARRLVSAAVAMVLLSAGWWLIDLVFASDRGVGFRDEGLYLLAADPPSATARWVTPFGWHTAPFFDLLGHDIARLRTFAVWVTVLAGAGFGWVVGRRVTDDAAGRDGRLVRCGLAAIGGLGGPLLTSGLLRTPGYNWVNLVGLLVASTGAVLATLILSPAATRSRDSHRNGRSRVTTPEWWAGMWRSRRAHAAAALLAGGVWFTVPAKPSSAPLFLLAAAVFVAPRLRRRTWGFAGLTAAWGLAFTAFGLVARWWPTNFLAVLARSAQFPPLDRNQTVPGAFRDVLRTPKVAWQDLAELRPAAVALMVAAVVVAAIARRRPNAGRVVRLAPLALSTVAAVGTAVPWPVLGLPNPPVRFDWYGTTNAGVLLFVGALLHLLANWRSTAPEARRQALAIAGLCVAAVFIFGFGSALSIYHQAALAAALMWCATGAVVASAGERTLRPIAVGIVTAAACALFVSNTVDSRHHPFDFADVAEQTTPITFGAHDDELLVDPATASFLGRLQAIADDQGLCEGDPLIGMVWQWTSTTAFAMGALVTEHLILTIFGYPDAADVLDVTMNDLSGPEWRDGWVLTTDPATIDGDAAAELRLALDRLPEAIGRTFPADYTLVGEVDGTQFWRPTDLADTTCA